MVGLWLIAARVPTECRKCGFGHAFSLITAVLCAVCKTVASLQATYHGQIRSVAESGHTSSQGGGAPRRRARRTHAGRAAGGRSAAARRVSWPDRAHGPGIHRLRALVSRWRYGACELVSDVVGERVQAVNGDVWGALEAKHPDEPLTNECGTSFD